MRQRLVGSLAITLAAVIACSAQEPKLSFAAPDIPRTSTSHPLPQPRVVQDAALQLQPARFTFIGVKRAEDCGPALKALITELETLEYPADWQFKIACSPLLWDRVQRKVDRLDAPYAISELKHKITFFNGAVFRLARYKYRRSVSHELGHIRCDCKDEDTAERFAKRLESGQPTAALR